MRHRNKTIKLGRTSAHREALLASLVCHLIREKRIKTTLAKAKAARTLAEKMVTLGKKENLASRRLAISRLRQQDPVKELFDTIAPGFKEREGGYTRIYKLGRRSSDSSEMAILEWVEAGPVEQKKKKKKKAAKAKKSKVQENAEAVEEVVEAVEETAEDVVEQVAEAVEEVAEAGDAETEEDPKS